MKIQYTLDVTPEHAEHANRLVQQAGGPTRFEKDPNGNYELAGEIVVEEPGDADALVRLVRWYAGDLTEKRKAAGRTRRHLEGGDELED